MHHFPSDLGRSAPFINFNVPFCAKCGPVPRGLCLGARRPVTGEQKQHRRGSQYYRTSPGEIHGASPSTRFQIQMFPGRLILGARQPKHRPDGLGFAEASLGFRSSPISRHPAVRWHVRKVPLASLHTAEKNRLVRSTVVAGEQYERSPCRHSVHASYAV